MSITNKAPYKFRLSNVSLILLMLGNLFIHLPSLSQSHHFLIFNCFDFQQKTLDHSLFGKVRDNLESNSLKFINLYFPLLHYLHPQLESSIHLTKNLFSSAFSQFVFFLSFTSELHIQIFLRFYHSTAFSV